MNGKRAALVQLGAIGALALLLALPSIAATPEVETQPEATAETEAPELAPRSGGCCGCGAGGGERKGCGQRGKARGAGGGCGRHGGAQGTETGTGMRGRGAGAQGGMMGGHRTEMRNAHALIAAHTDIKRQVEELPNGIRTVTTTTNPELLPTLREHVAEMAALIEGGGRIRNWDPLFATIFDHSEAITMEIEEIENGVVVVETSTDPKVAALIRAHAYKVDDFVARGQEAYRESTPLPEEWEAGEKRGARGGIPCWTGGS